MMADSDSSPRLTDERLRSWLDSNQLDRERLCIAVFAADGRFSAITPRQPRGGADGGRDIECKYEDRTVWCGIGFQNTVSDTPDERREAVAKCKTDMQRARDENGKLDAFICATNVQLTVGDQDIVKARAREIGYTMFEVFDRERLRLLLDSPEGLAARFQYLRIPLSEAEQAAFFARWGTNVESLLSTAFARLERRLDRLEFNDELSRPIRDLTLAITLRQPVTMKEQMHVRAKLSIGGLFGRRTFDRLGLLVADNRGRADGRGSGDGLCGAFWFVTHDKPLDVQSSFQSIRPDPLRQLITDGDCTEMGHVTPQPTLRDLSGSWFAVFANSSMVQRMERVVVTCNDYPLWTGPVGEMSVDEVDSPVNTPMVFAADELADPWVRLLPKYGARISFEGAAPERLVDRYSTAP